MYATLKNNSLFPSPGEIKIDGATTYNPGSDALRALGYKEVIYPTTDSLDPSPMRPVYTEDAEHIYVSYVPEEAAPEPDPALLREQAYRAEADHYLLAYEGYLLEGRTAEAEYQKTLYLAKKAEIRNAYHDK